MPPRRSSSWRAKTATEPFKYHDKGTMATIGRRSAVVQLAGGLRLRGTLAWLAWFALHLVYLLGGRNRVSTLINLTYRYVSWGHGGAVIVGDEPASPSLAARKPSPAAPGARSPNPPAGAQPAAIRSSSPRSRLSSR